jgi:hypothetical protein
MGMLAGALRAEIAVIPDPSLRASIESALGIAPGDSIATEALAQLHQLQAAGLGITSLSGLEHATSLETLVLRNNLLHDLSPLQNLTSLRRLEVDGNGLSDLTALSGLTNLTALFAHQNEISDLRPLAGLTRLEDLILFDNAIVDLEALSALTALKRLNLSQNAILTIDALAPLANLEVLFLANNFISDLHGLSDLAVLRQLDLDNNRLYDLSALQGLAALETLNVRSNYLVEDAAILLPLLSANMGLSVQLTPQKTGRSYNDWLTEWNISEDKSAPEASPAPYLPANILLFSMGSGPTVNSTPQVTASSQSGDPNPRLRFTRDLSAVGIIRLVEWSRTLSEWHPASIDRVLVLDEPIPNVQWVEAVVSLPDPELDAPLFLRLRVASSP